MVVKTLCQIRKECNSRSLSVYELSDRVKSLETQLYGLIDGFRDNVSCNWSCCLYFGQYSRPDHNKLLLTQLRTINELKGQQTLQEETEYL